MDSSRAKQLTGDMDSPASADSRPQEGSGEECGRDSDWGFFGNSAAAKSETIH